MQRNDQKCETRIGRHAMVARIPEVNYLIVVFLAWLFSEALPENEVIARADDE